MPKNVNAKGRNSTGRFVKLDHALLSTPAYRALSLTARALLVELVMLYDGDNNGSIFLSVADAMGRLGLADHHSIRRAFDELQDMGFLVMTADAAFHVKTADKARARTWRLTFHPVAGRSGPTNDFRDREPSVAGNDAATAKAAKQARQRMDRGLRALSRARKQRQASTLETEKSTVVDSTIGAVVDSTIGSKTSVPAVVDSTTGEPSKPQNSNVRANGGFHHTYTSYHLPQRIDGSQLLDRETTETLREGLRRCLAHNTHADLLSRPSLQGIAGIHGSKLSKLTGHEGRPQLNMAQAHALATAIDELTPPFSDDTGKVVPITGRKSARSQ